MTVTVGDVRRNCVEQIEFHDKLIAIRDTGGFGDHDKEWTTLLERFRDEYRRVLDLLPEG
jgi:hypothetical protein